ncbi:MAG: RloB family protein [Clostridiales Family XIII bacterium]|jgi:hypothetical protein|nr:RloB family protein [Clostridiales Family XIII bacterium]
MNTNNDNVIYILILCEGKTEKLYFDLLKRVRRISRVEVEIIPHMGQHKNLIDSCIEYRNKVMEDKDLRIDEIETWAISDNDKTANTIHYQDLLNYAEFQEIHLAYSDPQFEIYLLQHFFELNKSKQKKAKLESLLDAKIKEIGYDCGYSKSDLDWCESMLDKEPKRLDRALEYADKLGNHVKPPFTTVHHLVYRLLEFSV